MGLNAGIVRSFARQEPIATSALVWDDQESRQQLIGRIVVDCDITPLWITDLSALGQIRGSHFSQLAIVALDGRPEPGARCLAVIRHLRHKGFTIISCGDDAHAWPIGARCRPLLAGATWILDSARPEFADELQDLIRQHTHAEAARQTDEDNLKQTMRTLGIVGESPHMLALFRQVQTISALSDLPTLITGETGTGKELLARALHCLDRKRCNGPFVAVNCGAISSGLAESELFGHRRGAFTGADRDRKGLIRAAEGGVLFLDEIGELHEALQVKLLRVLQERQVLGLGEDSEVAVNVRIIAATNRNLDTMVQQHHFRADLFHRLHVLSIHIPPLRERPSDIPLLIEYFIQKHRALASSSALTVTPAFIEALMQLELSGNVRQLENLIQAALVNRRDAAPLDLQHLPPEVWRQLAERSEPPVDSTHHDGTQENASSFSLELSLDSMSSQLVKLLTAQGWTLVEALRYCERILVEGALQLNHGNQSQTARLLGITPRSIYSLMRRHRLKA